MNKKHLKVLMACQLFKKISSEEIESICQELNTKPILYSKNEIIVEEGEQCDALSIVLSGTVELHTFFISGDVSSLITLDAGSIFGEAILFSPKESYPISASAISNVEILQLTKKHILNLMEHHPQFLENYLALLSKKLLFLNDKFKLLSLTTIRGKIAHVLIKLSKEQNSLLVQLPFTKEKMALHICTRRPSLSRELAKMKSDGLIDYEKSTVKILDYEGLKDELF